MDLSLEFFLPILAAVLGACMGSFLNVVAHRSLEDSLDRKSVVRERCRSRWSPYH